MPVRVSVWNLSQTTVEQAIEFRGNATDISCWAVTMNQIQTIQSQENAQRLKVVADPLADPGPGAGGHCGIEGLDYTPADRVLVKTIRDKLAQACVRIDRPR